MTTVRIPSETTPGVEYRVDVRNGAAVCDCPGFRTAGHCKHAEKAKESTMVNEEQPTEESEETAMVVAEDGPPLPIPVTIEERTLPSQGELQIISTIARTVIGAKGHAVPQSIDTPAKAAAVMLAGWELGLKPMAALRHVYVVNGRTEPDGSAMMGLVKAGDRTATFTFHEYSDQACDVSLHRGGHLVARCEYTRADAEKSGQLKKPGPWQQYTRDMLAWSAIKRVCRLGAPDLINAIPNIDVRQAGAVLPEPIETVAIGASGRTVAEERATEEALERQNAPYQRLAKRPPGRKVPDPRLALIGEAGPEAVVPDPESEVPGTVEERPDDGDEGERAEGQAALLPPDPKDRAHP